MVALFDPNLTPPAPVVPLKPVPAIVTDVPPAVVPEVGEIEVTVGGAAVTVSEWVLVTLGEVEPVWVVVTDAAAAML